MSKYYKYDDDYGFFWNTDEYENDNRKDAEKYLDQLNKLKEELKKVPLFKDTNSQLLKELLDNSIECLSNLSEFSNQEFVIYYDENYIAMTYKGLPDYYELSIENLVIVSRKFDLVYFISIEEEMTDDDYYTFSNVTIFKKDDIGYMKREYTIPEVPTYIQADFPDYNYDIDKFLLEYHINADDISR